MQSSPCTQGSYSGLIQLCAVRHTLNEYRQVSVSLAAWYSNPSASSRADPTFLAYTRQQRAAAGLRGLQVISATHAAIKDVRVIQHPSAGSVGFVPGLQRGVVSRFQCKRGLLQASAQIIATLVVSPISARAMADPKDHIGAAPSQ